MIELSCYMQYAHEYHPLAFRTALIGLTMSNMQWCLYCDVMIVRQGRTAAALHCFTEIFWFVTFEQELFLSIYIHSMNKLWQFLKSSILFVGGLFYIYGSWVERLWICSLLESNISIYFGYCSEASVLATVEPFSQEYLLPWLNWKLFCDFEIFHLKKVSWACFAYLMS